MNLGCNLRPGFVSKIRGNGENQESSEQGPPSTKAPRAPPALPFHWIPGIIPALLHRFASRTGYPTGGSSVGCSKHPPHLSLCFCNTAGGGRRGNPAWVSRVSLCVPGVQAPNHGQGWSPEEARGVSNQQQKHQASSSCSSPSLLQPGLSTGPEEILDSQRAAQEKRFQKDLGGSSLCISPKGAAEQTWRSCFKDIPKSKYLKC